MELAFITWQWKASAWNALTRAVFKALDQPPQIQYIDMPHDLVSKYQNYSQAGMARNDQCIEKMLRQWSLEDAVIRLCEKNYLVSKNMVKLANTLRSRPSQSYGDWGFA